MRMAKLYRFALLAALVCEQTSWLRLQGIMQMLSIHDSILVGWSVCVFQTQQRHRPAIVHIYTCVWIQLKNKYGSALPADHLIGMLWKIIPEDLKEDIKKDKDLTGKLDAQMSWIFSKISERTDTKLSKLNLSKLQRQLKTPYKNTKGINPEVMLINVPPSSKTVCLILFK